MGYSHINPFVNSLMGFPGSIEVAFPNTEAQLCILHMAGGSVQFVAWKDRKTVVADLKGISHCFEELARDNLEFFS